MKITNLYISIIFFLFLNSFLRANPNQQLLEAIKLSDVNKTRTVLSEGANPNYVIASGKRKGLTPLMLAIVGKDTALIKLLLQKGANPNYKIPSGAAKGFTPLMISLSTSKLPEINLLLLRFGANPKETLTSGELKGTSILLFAVLYRHPRVVQELVERGANPNQIHEFHDKYHSINQSTVLDLAEETNQSKMVDLLKSLGAKKAKELLPDTWLEIPFDSLNW
ncbi:MAG: ankyrin repeat domain-containing protein [Spirochaetota bacterium]